VLWRWWNRARVWVLVAVVATMLVPAGAAQAAAGRGARHHRVTVEGRYGVLHADPSVVPDVDVLQTGHRRYQLRFPSAGRPVPGATVRVTGRLTGKKGRGGPVIAVSHVASPPPEGLRAEPRLATSGDVSVLVVLAQWTAADGVTPDGARAQILDDDAAWLREASYGRVNLSGDVTPWLRVAPPAAACDFDDIATKAGQAALAAGFDTGRYDRVVFYMPHQDCAGVAGQAMVGGALAWVNGNLDRRVTIVDND